MATTDSGHQFIDKQPEGDWQGILLHTLAELHTETDLHHKKRELRMVQVFVFLFAGFLLTIFVRGAIVSLT
jgi:hypothetical protein